MRGFLPAAPRAAHQRRSAALFARDPMAFRDGSGQPKGRSQFCERDDMSRIEHNSAGADGVSSRFEAVTAFIDEVRQITRDFGVDEAALDRIGQRLVALGRRTELFPKEHFPVEPGSLGSVHRLAEDADGRFALVACAGVPGELTYPHQLTTWAVIGGVCGQARIAIYRRLDDDPPGVGRLQRAREGTVAQGRAVPLSIDEVHSIESVGPEHALFLCLYGLAIDRLAGNEPRNTLPPCHKTSLS